MHAVVFMWWKFAVFFLFRVVHLQYLHPSLNLYALVYASSTKSQLTTLMIIVFRPG